MSIAYTDENRVVFTTMSEELATFVLNGKPEAIFEDRSIRQDERIKPLYVVSNLNRGELLEALEWYDSMHTEATHAYDVRSGDVRSGESPKGEPIRLRLNAIVYSDRDSIAQELQRMREKRNQRRY